MDATYASATTRVDISHSFNCSMKFKGNDFDIGVSVNVYLLDKYRIL